MEPVQIGITAAWHTYGATSLGKALTIRALLMPKRSDHSEVLLCSREIGKKTKVFETRSHHVGQAGLELVGSFLLCLPKITGRCHPQLA